MPVPNSPGRFLVLRNNTAGLDLLDFKGTSPRTAETRVLDLASPSMLGALRLDRLRDISAGNLTVEIKTGNGSDDLEGWTPWTLPLRRRATAGGQMALAGGISSSTSDFRPMRQEVLKLTRGPCTACRKNHRPQMQEFHFLSPNYAIVPAAGRSTGARDHDRAIAAGRRRQAQEQLPSSQVAPSTGTQVAFWTVVDPDGDNILYTFSIRKDGDPNWTDITVDSHEAFAQFDTAHLADGIYFTRLVAKETAPAPLLTGSSPTFETDNLVVDHTPPVILEATVKRTADAVTVSVSMDGMPWSLSLCNRGDFQQRRPRGGRAARRWRPGRTRGDLRIG